MSETKSRAVLYCRYSSHNQREVSIDQQVNACEAFAERENIRIVKLYADKAMTGTNDRRPQFQQMISEAPGLGVQYVIVYSLDRFARDKYDSAVYKRQLKQRGIRVISATENISDDPSGTLLETMLEGLAQYYSEELARKIKRGMMDNASRGLTTGPPPYGYRIKDGHYEEDPEQAEIIREIFGRVLAGEARADVIRDLNARRIKTSRGGEWTKSSLGRVIRNEKYTGVYLYGDVRVEGGLPKILDEETFNAMQVFLATTHGPGPKRRRNGGGVYLLTGRVFCGDCGSPMVGVSGTSKTGDLHHYYICKGRRYKKSCPRQAIRREQLERDVADAIKTHILTDEMIEQIADLAIEQQEQKEKTGPLAMLRKDRASVQVSLRNLMSAIEQGIITPTTKARLNELEDEQQRLDAQIAAEEYAQKSQRATREDIAAAMYLFKDGDVDDPQFREALIDTFVQTVYVYEGRYEITFHLGAGKREKISLPQSSHKGSAGSPPCPYPNGATIVAVGIGAFMLTCPRK